MQHLSCVTRVKKLRKHETCDKSNRLPFQFRQIFFALTQLYGPHDLSGLYLLVGDFTPDSDPPMSDFSFTILFSVRFVLGQAGVRFRTIMTTLWSGEQKKNYSRRTLKQDIERTHIHTKQRSNAD